MQWQGRNPWTSQTDTDRRPGGGSWQLSGQPPSGRTQPRSERTASKSIFPRLRLDFEKIGSGANMSPCSHIQTTLKLAFFLNCYSSFIHLLSNLDSHPQCPSPTPLVCRMCQVSSPIARISVSRNVWVTRVGWVFPGLIMIHGLQVLSSSVLDGYVCSFSAFAKCHLKSAALKTYQQPGLWAKKSKWEELYLFQDVQKWSKSVTLQYFLNNLRLPHDYFCFTVLFGVNVNYKLNITKLL